MRRKRIVTTHQWWSSKFCIRKENQKIIESITAWYSSLLKDSYTDPPTNGFPPCDSCFLEKTGGNPLAPNHVHSCSFRAHHIFGCYVGWKIIVWKNKPGENVFDTVDGRNPANHLIGSLSHYLQGFIYIPGGAGFLPSTYWIFVSSRVCEEWTEVTFMLSFHNCLYSRVESNKPPWYSGVTPAHEKIREHRSCGWILHHLGCIKPCNQ